MTLRRTLAGLCAVLCPTGLVLANASPAAAAQGVAVQISEVPDQFAAGARPETLTVAASKRKGDCLKVRWSMVLRVEGMRLDQVRVDRIEETGSFPLDVRSEGDSARLTDVQLDPGTLCRDRTVTARYEVNFAKDVAGGRVTFSVEAYDAELRLLESDTATRTVEGAAPEPTESPTAPPEETAPEGPPVAPDEPAQPQAAAPAGNQIPLPAIGFLIGALMLFLGFGLLLQVYRRMRRRAARPVTAMPVTAVLPGRSVPVPRPPEWHPPDWHPGRSRRRAFP
ncbi:MAG TPA: hypothetical protein VFR67_24150 [Pilimelia sp.]|nr:hypothetical protein [Pilimelia sp.]